MKLDNKMIDDICKEAFFSLTRNGLALFGFDTMGMMFLQAARDTCEDILVKQVPEKDFNDGELVIKPLFEDWSVSQFTTKAGIKKLVRTIQEAMLSKEYSDSLVYEGSTKVQISPKTDGTAIINFLYVRERNNNE